jgi:hypothetical protein
VSRSLLDRARRAGEDDPLVGTILVARLDVAAQNHAHAEGHDDPYPAPRRMRQDRHSSSARRHDEERLTRARVFRTPPGGGRNTAPQTAVRGGESMSYYAPLSVLLAYENRQVSGGGS